MKDAQARALEVILKRLPAEDRKPLRRVVEKATTEVLAGERSDVSWISTEAIDRDKEVVRSAGMNLSVYKGNPVVTLGHNYGQPPVGRSVWQKRARDGDRLGIKAKTQYPGRPDSWPEDKPWTPDTAFALVQAGLMAGKSIGFLPLKWHSPDYGEIGQNSALKDVARVIDEWLLLEYACTWLPTNQEALVEAVSKSQIQLHQDSLAALGLTAGVPPAPQSADACPPMIRFTALDDIGQVLERRLGMVDLVEIARAVLMQKRGRV
jgi:hypothetical protein